MSTPDEPARAETRSSARRRRRRKRPQPTPLPPQGGRDSAPKPGQTGEEAEGVRKRTRADAQDRGLRELVGGGASQLGVSGALRGRDVNRPSEADLAEAEQTVVLVRRNWTPPPAG